MPTTSFTTGVHLPHGPEYVCLSVMMIVFAAIVVISIYSAFWGRK